VATVSLALRNDPRISAPVRERIQQLAVEMGHRPNPLLSAYQASVRSKKPAAFRATLGWLNDHPDKDFWRKPWTEPLWEGAHGRARELGYELDEIWFPEIRVEEPEENVRKIQKILRARGIAGVILPSLNRAQHLVQPWDGFAVVCIGGHHHFVEHSTIRVKTIYEHHTVNPDALYNIHLAFEKLREGGRKRIGLAIPKYFEHESERGYSSGFLRSQMDLPTAQRVPILFSDETAQVEAWARKHRPDAVICSHSEVAAGIRSVGIKVLGDTKLVHLNLASDVAGWSGIDQRRGMLGRAAVDMLTAHLIRNDVGVPACAKHMRIEGVWVDGAPESMVTTKILRNRPASL